MKKSETVTVARIHEYLPGKPLTIENLKVRLLLMVTAAGRRVTTYGPFDEDGVEMRRFAVEHKIEVAP